MEKSLIYSYKATIVMLALYALGLAIATFIEKYWGTDAAKIIIYYSPVFFVLQLLLVLNLVFTSIKNQLFKKGKWGFILIHSSLIIMLAGAFTTHILGKEGMIHIREGETQNTISVQTGEGGELQELPFSLELLKFTLTRYPGSSSPSSYESHLRIHPQPSKEGLPNEPSFEKKVSMNNVLDYEGYRFFQSSFDQDEKGTILSVNRDVAGRNITYTGYSLLVLGFILSFFGKNTRFRQLVGNLKKLHNKSLLFGLFLLLSNLSLSGQTPSVNDLYNLFKSNKINAEHAAQFGALPLQSIEGRIEPVNTFSSEALRKLHHAEKIGGLNSDQFLLSLLALPDMWAEIPFITNKNNEIARKYGLTEKQFAYVELFDEKGEYKLNKEVEQIFHKSPAERSHFDKDLIKLDDKISILYQLLNGEMLPIFPVAGDSEQKWITSHELMQEYLESVRMAMKTGDWANANKTLGDIRKYQSSNANIEVINSGIQAELLYNRLDIFRQCKKVDLIAGGLLLVFAFIALFKKRKWIQWTIRCLCAFVFCGLLYHLFGIGLRWYIAGYAPWSNAYETMIYVAFITVFAGFLFVRQSAVTCALATLFGGIILFVSVLNWMDPQISPLVPVLKSPWLMVHVAVIVAAYGFFGVSFLLGITNLSLLSFNRKNNNASILDRIQEMSIINEMSLWAGLALMTIGTFVGAVWANESWGRYWGWDSKETWALVTIVVYAIVTHLRLIKKYDNPILFNWMSILAFASVLMTYFGVNYLLDGMHSYG
jgi:cytochrome c-type biogenesis protein CcsB